ncbi:hypothetical protein CLU82_2772 [Flavobacterium sp. 5]|nr:hypothetical protein CLU82_2772 [Flavobacterium sp. 5]
MFFMLSHNSDTCNRKNIINVNDPIILNFTFIFVSIDFDY